MVVKTPRLQRRSRIGRKLLHWRFLRRCGLAAAAVVATAVAARRCEHNVRSVVIALPGLSFSSFSPPISPLPPLRLDVESLRLRLGPLRPLFWLLARPCAFLWRCACQIHHRSGSTMISSTMSCVCSTHRCLCTLIFHFLLLQFSPTHSFRIHPLASSPCSLLFSVFLAPLALFLLTFFSLPSLSCLLGSPFFFKLLSESLLFTLFSLSSSLLWCFLRLSAPSRCASLLFSPLSSLLLSLLLCLLSSSSAPHRSSSSCYSSSSFLSSFLLLVLVLLKTAPPRPRSSTPPASCPRAPRAAVFLPHLSTHPASCPRAP